MRLHIFSPYVVGLSPRLIKTLDLKPGDNVCFAATRDAKVDPKELWIGKESIFANRQTMSYSLKANHVQGYHGFSAKALVYELNMDIGYYPVDIDPVFNRTDGIDWYRVHIDRMRPRTWKAIHSCSIGSKKKINLDSYENL